MYMTYYDWLRMIGHKYGYALTILHQSIGILHALRNVASSKPEIRPDLVGTSFSWEPGWRSPDIGRGGMVDTKGYQRQRSASFASWSHNDLHSNMAFAWSLLQRGLKCSEVIKSIQMLLGHIKTLWSIFVRLCCQSFWLFSKWVPGICCSILSVMIFLYPFTSRLF